MTALNLPSELSRSFERLLAVVADKPGWVAFSGGVDSTMLLKAVGEVNPSSAVALFADSPLQSEFDRENAKWLAGQLRAELVLVPFDPLTWPAFTANSADRCYLCKKAIYRQFQGMLPEGFVLMDGTNRDDLSADRPGYRAVVELGVISPLARAGLVKADVRQLSRWLGLPNWNRPSSSCLATRFSPGQDITDKLLRQVEGYEVLVRAHVSGHIRTRLIVGRPDDLVVEIAREELERDDFNGLRANIVSALRRLVPGEVSFTGRDGVSVW